MKSRLIRQIQAATAVMAVGIGIGAIGRADDSSNKFQQNLTRIVKAASTAAPKDEGAHAGGPGIGGTGGLENTVGMDPYTHLPMPLEAAQWISPEWQDAGKTLGDVTFDLPLSEVVERMRQDFSNSFDVIVPSKWQAPDGSQAIDPGIMVTVKLRLKNVTATEIFNAMNLEFEAENTPVRWELKKNRDRMLAVLRIIPALLPHSLTASSPPEHPAEDKRAVFYVGSLLETGAASKVTMDDIFKTVCQVYDMAYGIAQAPNPSQGIIKFHEKAQLLLVTGSQESIDFVQHTLAALREKSSDIGAIDVQKLHDELTKAKEKSATNK